MPASPTPAPNYWVHNLDPFILRFPEGWPVEGIRWYGAAYVVGFLVAGALLHFYHKRGKSPLDSEKQSTLMFVLILGVMLGARLGEVFGYMLPRNPRLLWDDPLVIFRVNEGGMASHGGMVGVWLALGWFAWKHKTRFWLLMDIAVTLAPAGVFFGRLANFINGELWGRVTDVPWAVIFKVPGSSALRGAPLYLEPRHPSQLYAAGLEGLLLLAWAQWRFWRCKLPEGQLVGEMMLAYAAVRIFGEMFREPETQIGWVLGLTRGQFYSVFLVVLGIVAIVRARRAARAHSG